MQTVSTGLYENGEILNDSQNIRLLFQKFQNPILTQIKLSLQVSYDMDQANIVTYKFIVKSLEAEAASLGDHTLQGVGGISTCDEKAPEISIKGAGGTILTWFYPNWSKLSDWEKQSIFNKREQLNIKGIGKRNSFVKKKRAGLHQSSTEINQLRKSNVRSCL